MALSAETLVQLEAALKSVDAFYERRLDEVDRDVRNLRDYGAVVSDLGIRTSEAGTDEALSILESLGVAT